MRPSRFTDDEMRHAIAQVDAGTPLVVMCRKLGITQTTFYRWRARYAGTGTGDREARALREENQRLKQLVAELYLERQAMKEVLSRNSRVVRR